MKKLVSIIIVVCLTLVLFGCTTDSGSSTSNNYTTTTNYSSSYSKSSGYSKSSSSSSYSKSSCYSKDDVNSWMKDQAAGKNYSYDDGGEYYCMGKNNTCRNKTKNAYDLYCNSCDPNGDNVEG